ncbi:hypothetical protein [Algoriphagus mannitolivorans]|uniref:hypothetical protein n=1 Tax=Algoriphagus mannitolivorans TaxID=226504 RepID=UPI0004286F76|nr:hypothetical protein [Algoriphagus mannitolivorans]
MNSIYFTLCSNNYLAQAKTLGDSIIDLNPKAKFIIGLVDYLDSSIDYSFFEGFEIIPFDQLGYSEFDEMIARYNVIEFNTSVKPFYIEFIWKKYGANNLIFYLDPDIVLYRNLDHVIEALKSHSVVLTPMFCKAPEKTSFDELVALRHGMFNLGFIALRFTEESFRLVTWWKERLKTHCLIDKARGIFVDQKWMDLAPLLFDEVFILKHRGYNMAWWNFSERRLIELGEGYAVNQEDQLLFFFHFSGFRIGSAFITGRSDNSQFSYNSRPELEKLGKEYEYRLLINRYDFFSKIEPKIKFFEQKIGFNTKLKQKLKRLLSPF